MGCGSSKGVEGTDGAAGAAAAENELIGGKARVDNPDDEDDIGIMSAGEGQQFGASKPWIGAIFEPSNPPAADPSKPDTAFKLNHIYGYRCDSSQSANNAWIGHDGKIIYPAAAIGVVYDKGSNSQAHFGGNHNASKEKRLRHCDGT